MSVSLFMHNAGRSATTSRRVVAGFTLIDMAVTLSLMFIAAGIAMPLLDPGRLHINAAQRLAIGAFRLGRAAAISKGVHYQIAFSVTAPQIVVSRMKEYPVNSGTWVVDTTQVQTNPLPSGTYIATSEAGTSIEFNTRGFPVNITAMKQIDLNDKFANTKSLQVWPSGQVNGL